MNLASPLQAGSVLLMRILRKMREEDKGRKLIFTLYSNASIFNQVSTKLEEANFHKKFFSGLTVKYHETNIGDRGKNGCFCIKFVI